MYHYFRPLLVVFAVLSALLFVPASAQLDPLHITVNGMDGTVEITQINPNFVQFTVDGANAPIPGDPLTLNLYEGVSDCSGSPTDDFVVGSNVDGTFQQVITLNPPSATTMSLRVPDPNARQDSNCLVVMLIPGYLQISIGGASGVVLVPQTFPDSAEFTVDGVNAPIPGDNITLKLYQGVADCSGDPTDDFIVSTNGDGSFSQLVSLNPPLSNTLSLQVPDPNGRTPSNCLIVLLVADETATAEVQATQTADVWATATEETAATATQTAVDATQTAETIATEAENATATQTAVQITQTAEVEATATSESLATETAGAEFTATADTESTATAEAEASVTSSATVTQTAVAPTATDVPPTDEPPTATVELPGSVVVTITTNTGDPIPDDTVVCLDTTCIDLDAEFSSDDAPNGSSVTFADVAPGTHAVTASVAGVAAFAGTVDVLAGETAQVAIELQLDDDATPIAPTATTPAGVAPTSAPVVVLPSTGTGSSSTMPMLLILLVGSGLLMTAAIASRRKRT